MPYKTENGHNQKTFEEFKEMLSPYCNNISESHAKSVYDRFVGNYIICSIEEIAPNDPNWASEYERVSRWIKPEARVRWKFLYVHFSYDCGPFDFCPQDCPNDKILLCVDDGELYSEMALFEERRKNK